MDKYDPARRVNLAVDEWGIWTDVEPAPIRFPLSAELLRDALLAAVNINIFVHHAERVRMTNIAQMVNVLQSMILTNGAPDGADPDLSRLRHVSRLAGWHRSAARPAETWYNREEWTAPAVTGSAVRGKDGAVHVALQHRSQPAIIWRSR
jgi:alpha-N-arabinofuranosidase